MLLFMRYLCTEAAGRLCFHEFEFKAGRLWDGKIISLMYVRRERCYIFSCFITCQDSAVCLNEKCLRADNKMHECYREQLIICENSLLSPVASLNARIFCFYSWFIMSGVRRDPWPPSGPRYWLMGRRTVCCLSRCDLPPIRPFVMRVSCRYQRVAERRLSESSGAQTA